MSVGVPVVGVVRVGGVSVYVACSCRDSRWEDRVFMRTSMGASTLGFRS